MGLLDSILTALVVSGVAHCGGGEASTGSGGEGGSVEVGGGGSGGTGGEGGDPGAFTCGGVVCAESDPLARCVTEWSCGAANNCEATDAGVAGYQDKDSCTVDTCGEDGEWKHRPMTEAEISDGDPCTNDTCAPDVGPIHVGNCG